MSTGKLSTDGHGVLVIGEAIIDVGRIAAIAASITVSRPGADLPTTSELRSALE